MTNREELKWNQKKFLGVSTYHAETEVDGKKVSITIDKPYRTGWALRAWVDGQLGRYREYTKLADAKYAADEYLDTLRSKGPQA